VERVVSLLIDYSFSFAFLTLMPVILCMMKNHKFWRSYWGLGMVWGIYYETALWLWELRFGEKTEARDRAGRIILKGTYRQEGSEYGWDIYYNIPRKQNRAYRLRDFEIINVLTRKEKVILDENSFRTSLLSNLSTPEKY
jgi:hypothetical protein